MKSSDNNTNPNSRVRLDDLLVLKNLVRSRSQASDLVKRRQVRVNGKILDKGGKFIDPTSRIQVLEKDLFVSRAGNKLASIAKDFNLEFKNKIVLDVGSSTGGFTDFALQHKARMVVAVDVGTDQMHPRLRTDDRVMLFEKTDIRDFEWPETIPKPDYVLIDVSFISQRLILPYIAKLIGENSAVVSMCKPQFEGSPSDLRSGIVKNNSSRRQIVGNYEDWLRENGWHVFAKRDSDLAGQKGNLERFFLIKKL